jgi:hypothetical protein
VSRGIIRSYLSSLHTQQILNPDDLNKAVEVAHHSLNDALDDFGLEIVSLKAQRVTLHPDFEAVLQRKLIARENAQELMEAAKKAQQYANTRRFQAQGEADALIALAQRRKSRLLQQAAAELAAMEQEANAIKVKFNELAEGIATITRELDKPGGDQHVALAVAQALQGKKIIIVPQGALNLLDLNEILQSYAAAEILKKKTIAPQPADNKEAENPGATTTPKPKEDSNASGALNPAPDKPSSGLVEEVFGPPETEPEVSPPVVTGGEKPKIPSPPGP